MFKQIEKIEKYMKLNEFLMPAAYPRNIYLLKNINEDISPSVVIYIQRKQ